MIEAFQAALIRSARIAPDALERAEKAAEATGERLDRALVKLGYATEENTLQTWHEVTGLPVCAAAGLTFENAGNIDLPSAFLRAQRVLPLGLDDGVLRIAVVDPTDLFVPKAIEAKTGYVVRREIIAESTFTAAIERWLPDDADTEAGQGEKPASDADWTDIERLKDLASDAPVIRIVNALIDRAIERNASDIHLSVSGAGPTTKLRVDGILEEQEPISRTLYPAVVSRLKIMAGLDIAERRLPQDGRLRTTWRGRAIDLRVATAPHVAGEGVVMRILDRSTVPLRLDALGLDEHSLAGFRRALTAREGIVLVTGPTGSGKSTTLYAALTELRSPDRNIITVEDPVEVRVEGINQIPVAPAIGFDFARALRSVLRQDPDVIMVGEIRDRETAEVAVQAALTGHLVLATLHTNSAVAAIPRLVDMGVEPFLLASTMRGVLAQRLARKLCVGCRRAEALLEAAELGATSRQETSSGFVATGCAHCRQTGHTGRIALCEFVAVDETLQRVISKGTDEVSLLDQVRAGGWRSMKETAIERVEDGSISRVEWLRVFGAQAAEV
jgi:general secretion pathway protein E